MSEAASGASGVKDGLLPEDRELRALVVALARQMRCGPEMFYFCLMIADLFRQGRIVFRFDAKGELAFKLSEKGLTEWLAGVRFSEDETSVVRSFSS